MDNREKRITKEIYRMIGSLKKIFGDKSKTKQLEEDIAYKQKELQDHMGVKKFIRPMNSTERKAAKHRRKKNSNKWDGVGGEMYE